jgi:putative thioredoxin
MDFNTRVLDRSHSKPVVVDFWAPWCGPCRVLGPTIEQLAEEQRDRWELVKVNTEEEMDIAQQYRIQSIPNVKMFHKGEVVAEFAGALPRTAILNWLDENLPDKRKEGLEQLLKDVRAGHAGAVDKLRGFVKENPDLVEARLALAQQLIFSQPEEAEALVADIHLGDKQGETAEDVRLLAAFMRHPADESPAGRQLTKAQEALQKGDMASAVKAVIEATTADKSYADELPRKVAIALFRSLGPDHPVTRDYRWKFDMALY